MPTFVHGKNTYTSVNAVDLSTFTKQTAFERSKTTHDTTTYGPNRKNKSYTAGLGDGKITQSGSYSLDVAGPGATLDPLVDSGDEVALILRLAGTGAGKPQKTVNVIVTSFNTSHPVDDVVQWTAEYQPSGDVTTTTQA